MIGSTSPMKLSSNWLLYIIFILISTTCTPFVHSNEPSIKLPWPKNESHIATQGYSDIHGGIDFDFDDVDGDYILAVADGEIVFASNNGSWNDGYGNYIKIDHGNNYFTLYAHLDKVRKSSGFVNQGEIIGEAGTTGMSTSDHLHFEFMRGNTRIMPNFEECSCTPVTGDLYTSDNGIFLSLVGDGVTLYEQINHTGLLETLTIGTYPDLRASLIGSSSASSILVPDNWFIIAYTEKDFSGETITFYEDISDLNSTLIGSDSIASVQVGGPSQNLPIINHQFNSSDSGKFFVAITTDDQIYAFPISDEPQIGEYVGIGAVAAVADFDNDGQNEILAVREDDRRLRLYDNDNGQGFIELIVSEDAYPPENFSLVRPGVHDSAVADFDNNNLLDFAFSGRRCSAPHCGSSGEGLIQIHFNMGGNQFERVSLDVEGVMNRDMEGVIGLDNGDFNSDGFQDLAAQHYWSRPSANTAHLFIGNGDRSFDDNVVFSNSNPSNWQGGTQSMASGDFNNDGNLDLIVGQDDDGDPGQTWLYLGNGEGEFTYFIPAYDTNTDNESGNDKPGSGTSDAYDFDSDGNLDVIAAASNIGLLLFKGNGDGTFQDPITIDDELNWSRVVTPPEIQ